MTASATRRENSGFNVGTLPKPVSRSVTDRTAGLRNVEHDFLMEMGCFHHGPVHTRADSLSHCEPAHIPLDVTIEASSVSEAFSSVSMTEYRFLPA
ncbi:hypothetical protein J6590_068073 [Homalodisca vitripennis]|nr:hypothetical protein J6590_068073 [Homalodisca vitripennis]